MEGMGYDNVWFYENTEGGHGAGADNKQAAHMHALAWDFLWDQLQLRAGTVNERRHSRPPRP